LQARLSAQSWVSAMNVLPDSNGSSTWQVSVADAAAAEEQLLRLVLEDRALTVTEFGRKKYDLEEVFMSMVGEEQHVR
jgi:ABC-2 type transport system ATP-binding protein